MCEWICIAVRAKTRVGFGRRDTERVGRKENRPAKHILSAATRRKKQKPQVAACGSC